MVGPADSSSRALRTVALEAASPKRHNSVASFGTITSIGGISSIPEEYANEASPASEKQLHYLQERQFSCFAFLTLPCQLWSFVRSLHREFGGFVPVSVLQYGVNSGAGLSIAGLAQQYLYKDVLGLAGDPALMSNLIIAGKIPWTIKPVMGMMSDAYPLFGFHLTSYMGLAAAAGVLGYICVGSLTLAAAATVPCFILINFSVATPDVMIDASAAKLSKDVPERASDLQSLIWGSVPLGMMATAAVSATLLPAAGPKWTLLVVAVCPLCILVASVLRWLPEERLPPEQRRVDFSVFDKHKHVVTLAACMSAMAIMLAVLQILIESVFVRCLVIFICGAMLATSTYFSLRCITPLLAKTALFLFMINAVQPDLSEGAMQTWLTHAEGGPHFSKRVMAARQGVSAFGLLVGAIFYNKFLTACRYQRIFLLAQLAMVASSLLDLILVSRWNLSIGVPDVAFIMGDDVIANLVGRSFMMPLFVLSAKVCPDNLEATLFAVLMALFNLGTTVSTNFGAALTDLLGIRQGNFDMLPHAVVVRSLCRLLPIPLIFLLVPDLSPQDPIPGGEGSVYECSQYDKAW
mmetsp:Transcript_46648/g.117307  ORF Transcript_46648/g.117307 Transcript_46648/m.117307 type:complete len:578 (+) Transcript_46648:43-1776(+)